MSGRVAGTPLAVARAATLKIAIEVMFIMLQGFVGRSLGDPGLKPSVRVGEAAMREVAAFLLDHEHFASVPHTVMVKVRVLQNNHPSLPRVASGNDEIQLPLLMRDDIAGMESNYIRHD